MLRIINIMTNHAWVGGVVGIG